MGGLLLAFGLWLVAFSVLIRPEAPTARAQIVVGAGLVVMGAVLLATLMRRIRASARPQAELALPRGCVLHPGVSVPLRLRQPGPARLARLQVSAVCERRYPRQAMAPGSTAVTTIDEVEEVWAQDLLDARDIATTRREPFERVLTFAVPTLARPSGPTLPSGSIGWRLQVVTDTGRGPAVRDAFDVAVVLSSDAPPPQGDITTASEAATSPDLTQPDLATSVGCAVITLGFLLVGPLFLYLYFSGAPTRRGSPVMPLVAGILFTSLGLLALVSLWKGRRR